jgi:hypothetical protein
MSDPIPAGTGPLDDDGPVGTLTQHVSGDEDGPTCGWSFNVGDGRIVYGGEITRRRFAELDPEHRAALGNSIMGWFLMLYSPDGVRVLGKASDEDAARDAVEWVGRGMSREAKRPTAGLPANPGSGSNTDPHPNTTVASREGRR